MDQYIKWRIDLLRKYYSNLDKKSQKELIKNYTWWILHQIFALKSWKEYCEIIAWLLVEEGKTKIWDKTFAQLVYYVQKFFDKKRNILLNLWQRKILNALYIAKRRSK